MSYVPSLLCLGEILVDFTPITTPYSFPCYEQNPGGAPANVAVAFSKLGGSASFVGAVGSDTFGEFLIHSLEQHRVDSSGVAVVDGAQTTLAFVHLTTQGERSFSFYRNPGADTLLTQEDIPMDLIIEHDIFHFGSLSLTSEPSRSATLFALQEAKRLKNIISFDPNWRPLLWKHKKDAIELIIGLLEHVDLLKVSQEEALLLSGKTTIKEAASALVSLGPKLVAVTLGEDGCHIATAQDSVTVPTYDVPVQDTTGAGDGFWGALLYRYGTMGFPREPNLRELAQFANAAGAYATTKRGAIPALGVLDEIEALTKKK